MSTDCRCIFANAKLNSDLKKALIEVKENSEYASGGTLVPNEDPRRYKFLVRGELACHISMEVTYYSAKYVDTTHYTLHTTHHTKVFDGWFMGESPCTTALPYSLYADHRST